MSDNLRIPFKKSKTTGHINIEKLEKKIIQEQQRRIKPGECLKYVQTIIDPEFLSGQPGSKVLSTLVDLAVKYQIRPQKRPRIISWERLEQQNFAASAENLTMSAKYIPEKDILLLMYAEEFLGAAKSKILQSDISAMKNDFPGMNITILVFGLRNFCRNNGNVIRRLDIEYCLTELQILYNCNHRLQETADDVAATVAQFTKGISEIPYKKQQMDKFIDVNGFLLNDNKDCVRVEGTAGLSRLWQQHLTRLPLVTLETAEAIMNTYPKPKLLFEEYENTSDGTNVLSDLKVRRAGGPLSSIRRIGPELSRKIYKLYSSLDPKEKFSY